MQGLLQWPAAACAAVASFVYWLISYRRYRAIADVPTSRIGSAAQGYVELIAIGRSIGGTPLYSPQTGLPCLWYELIVEERDNDRSEWRRTHREVSDTSFILDDGTGRCVVDPEHADVITAQKNVDQQAYTRTTLRVLIPGTRLYALGHFTTDTGTSPQALHAAVGQRLASWKTDGSSKRFDRDGDGELSMEEWEQARAEARREVLRERSDPATQGDIHALCEPSDGRWFAISDIPPHRLARRLRVSAWASLAVSFMALAAAVWLFART
ncbi:MAG: hypothetical protein QM639_18635 [Rhodocyclaceae bacterium]